MTSPLRTMKMLALCAALVLVCAGAQARNKDFNQLAKIKDVECVHINKMLLKLASMSGEGLHIGENINIDGTGKGKEAIDQIDDLRVYTTGNQKSIDQMKTVVLDILKGKDWEPLIDVKEEDGQVAKIYQARKGKKVTNVIFALEEDEATVVILSGKLDIGKLMEQQAGEEEN